MNDEVQVYYGQYNNTVLWQKGLQCIVYIRTEIVCYVVLSLYRCHQKVDGRKFDGIRWSWLWNDYNIEHDPWLCYVAIGPYAKYHTLTILPVGCYMSTRDFIIIVINILFNRPIKTVYVRRSSRYNENCTVVNTVGINLPT